MQACKLIHPSTPAAHAAQEYSKPHTECTEHERHHIAGIYANEVKRTHGRPDITSAAAAEEAEELEPEVARHAAKHPMTDDDRLRLAQQVRGAGRAAE
jgi:hypothetical protein